MLRINFTESELTKAYSWIQKIRIVLVILIVTPVQTLRSQVELSFPAPDPPKNVGSGRGARYSGQSYFTKLRMKRKNCFVECRFIFSLSISLLHESMLEQGFRELRHREAGRLGEVPSTRGRQRASFIWSCCGTRTVWLYRITNAICFLCC